MHRFFVDPQTLAGAHVTLPGPVGRQIKDVLRLTAGERIILLDGSGYEHEVVLTRVGRDVVSGDLAGKTRSTAEPGINIRLYQGVLKGAKFELVLQKGVELGVSAFIPVVFRRSIASGDSGKFERWRRIIVEAAEQSGRARLPELSPPVPFGEALKHSSGLRIMPWEEERQTGLRQVLDSWLAARPALPDPRSRGPLARSCISGDTSDDVAARCRVPRSEQSNGLNSQAVAARCRVPGSQAGTPVLPVSIFIGPEGGITPDEISLAMAGGVIPVSLGPRILRAETAPLAVVAAVMYHFGELGPGPQAT